MKSFRKIFQTGLLGIAIVAATLAPPKQAQAAGTGDVIAAAGGALILGTLIGSAAQANHGYSQPYYAPAQTYQAAPQTYYAPAQPTYYAPAQPTYYAPAPTYVAPSYYYPPISFGISYSSGYHGGHRYYRGHGHARRHHRRHHGHHRRHHRRHHRH